MMHEIVFLVIQLHFLFLVQQAWYVFGKQLLIRLQQSRKNKKLDFKFNRACLDNPDLAIQDYCEEHSFALPLQNTDLPKINDLLCSLNLKPIIAADLQLLQSINNLDTHYIVDKMRTSYKH